MSQKVEKATDLGAAELRGALRASRPLFWVVALFSLFINALVLSGPLYMLNVYDRVLGSRSIETLVALTALVAFLYLMMSLLDIARGLILSRIASRFEAALSERVFAATLRATSAGRTRKEAGSALRDLDSVRRLITSPATSAIFDLPFAPIFFLGIFLFHPLLGWVALIGAAVLVSLALYNQRASQGPLEKANAAAAKAEQAANQIRQESDLVQSLGMRGASLERWRGARDASLGAAAAASELNSGIGAVIKAVRLFLQSAMLGVGAYLVLQDAMTAGAMIAGSILMGRALSPVEIIVGQSASLQRGREGWNSLARLLETSPVLAPRTALPPPAGRLEVEQVTVIPPGEQAATLRMVSFSVRPGQAVGVIGPSGAGKSTLARALTGAWRPAAGRIRLDGAALDQYDSDVLGRYVGYLPQQVTLFDGTIKENIARLAPEPDDESVTRAAIRAGAHDMILRLPDGYDTRIAAAGGRLSGGQIQRIGLARALYGDPVLVVLDEPNANLDNDGSAALNAAIRSLKAEGVCVLIIAHRPTALRECEMILMIENGMRRAFGSKDEVLREVVVNHKDLHQVAKIGSLE